ncbi:MAG TPA: M23 family metallopeptidase [Longimicrobium sp.]|jgi:murein DD-endopeptidase MepM/ murein hydrolase activator NlpD|nr:M23 family metallopeptidase [Longimicrobium sp.]
MPRSRWTLMLVPHDNERVLSWQVTRRTVRTAISGAAVLVLLFAIFGVGFFAKQGRSLHNAQLRRENQLLAAEVDQMREQMAELNQSIEQLALKDEQYRTIAGLPELDNDVKKVGIGGPGSSLADAALMHLNPGVGRKLESTEGNLGVLARRARLLQASLDEALGALRGNHERMARTPSIAPASGHLSSLFSSARAHPVLRISRPHKGIDIAARTGEPILAPGKGRVRFSGNRANGYGYMVEIDHGYGYITRFAHASRLHVRTGEMVHRGDVIAEVGSTGLTSGPHLHYEVEQNGRQVDPLNFIVADAIPD